MKRVMKKLAGLRVTLGFTQKEVAKLLGVTQGAVSLWERGASIPNSKHLQILSSLYGVSMQEILEVCLSSQNKRLIRR